MRGLEKKFMERTFYVKKPYTDFTNSWHQHRHNFSLHVHELFEAPWDVQVQEHHLPDSLQHSLSKAKASGVLP